ncbi:sulfotransferase family cytosolic 1B member 1, partial [Aplysia californica]|uniref:Sulfotransferase family cytosolic 1B member 1 n=1 Tax=Aplysia californica TaxID=6500 RepID=A0ABM0ZVM1_APLCA
MTEEWVVAEDGCGMKMLRLPDGRFAGVGYKFELDTLINLTSLPLRDDDVLLCSYPKSGCHWLWQNIRFLLDDRVTLDAVDKETGMVEIHSREYFHGLPSPRILNIHERPEHMPADLMKGKAKIVFVYRNPKDVAVSFFHHFKGFSAYCLEGNFSNFLKRFVQGLVISGGIFDYLKEWETFFKKNPHIPRIILSYENFKMNPIPERRRLASYLCTQPSDLFLQEIKDATSLDVMRDLKGEVKNSAGQSVFYRKGKIGDWKNYFTV